MAMVDGDAKLARAAQNTAKTDDFIDGMLRDLDEAERRAGNDIEAKVTARVRQMITQNLAGSGVQVRTGKLAKAVANVQVTVNLGKRARISIKMPAKVQPYENGAEFYPAAAAVNYGSVRGLNDKNKRRRKTFKNQAQRRAKFSKDPAKKSQETLGTVVTRPFDYWELTSSQKTELARMVGDLFADIVFG